jgi:hypothetical protein
MPFRSRSKGREAFAGSSWTASAPSALKLAKIPNVWMLSETPPAIARSISPSWSICAPWTTPRFPAAHAAPMQYAGPVIPRLSAISPAGLFATVRGLWWCDQKERSKPRWATSWISFSVSTLPCSVVPT